MSKLSVHDLGGYLREQRQAAQLSVRQLAALAGVSNPYLSQIERGLKRPSAEILQQLARALQVSAETIYVQAGILDERVEASAVTGDGPRADVDVARHVLDAIAADPNLSDRQRDVLVEVYTSFVPAARQHEEATGPTAGGTAADGTSSDGSVTDLHEPIVHEPVVAPRQPRRRTPRDTEGKSAIRVTARRPATEPSESTSTHPKEKS